MKFLEYFVKHWLRKTSEHLDDNAFTSTLHFLTREMAPMPKAALKEFAEFAEFAKAALKASSSGAASSSSGAPPRPDPEPLVARAAAVPPAGPAGRGRGRGRGRGSGRGRRGRQGRGAGRVAAAAAESAVVCTAAAAEPRVPPAVAAPAAEWYFLADEMEGEWRRRDTLGGGRGQGGGAWGFWFCSNCILFLVK